MKPGHECQGQSSVRKKLKESVQNCEDEAYVEMETPLYWRCHYLSRKTVNREQTRKRESYETGRTIVKSKSPKPFETAAQDIRLKNFYLLY